ncbi:DNA-directed RNA polymerase subunit beta' [Candidatus Parcubacteria bacterium]|nr:DNA-directed RNA polymerase subunit beta' [Candidatus Parcubacteria bacterium]
MHVADLESIIIKVASPEEILKWSHGEITKPETINYRTQRAEKDGLFCERIFGPQKDYECYCGKYKRIRYKGVVCDKCGVEVTKSSVRRERMGHIALACPVSHIWFLRGVPSRIGTVLNIPVQQLEKVIYFASYIITEVDEEAKKKVLEEIDKEYQQKLKVKSEKLKVKKEELKIAKDRAREEVLGLKPLKIISEIDYHNLSLKYGQIFKAGTGAETLRKIFEEIDLKKIVKELEKEYKSLMLSNPQKIKSKEGSIDSSEKDREKKDDPREKKESSLLLRRKFLRRLRMLQKMLEADIRPEWMFSTVLPVLPPDLRPMVQLDGGRYASSDLNDLYRRVINRNNRLKYLLEINAPEVIVRNEKRMLQEAVDALIDNTMRKGTMTQATTGGQRLLKSLADMLKGKQGRFRQNLLGKRVDYSGRSVIVVGPDLKLNQCGLPKKMALELFKPFVIKGILDKELAYNVRGASRLIEDETDDVWAILEEVVKDKLVLLNRAPTLHRLGIQAFQPVLIEGEAIRIHPLVCGAFNADFDGDQMAVHLPLSDESQKEARELMLSTVNLLKPATGTSVSTPNKDIVLGCYWITKIKEDALGQGKIFGSKNEAILAKDTGLVDLRAKIKVRFKEGELKETSVGRILFNITLPDNYPFVNEGVNAKKIEKIVNNIIESYDNETVGRCLDKIKDLGFNYSTLSGITWGMDDLIVPKEKKTLVKEAEKDVETIYKHYKKGLLSKEERVAKTIEVWQKTKSQIEKLVPQALPPLGSVFSIVDSGARGSWAQPVQMSGMKGLVINPAGQIIELPVKSSFKEGFNALEYFISTHGARKGTTDTALRTSTAGYLTRRLIDVAHEVIITEEDCKDKTGITVFKKDADESNQDFLFKIIGRVALEDIKVPGLKSKDKSKTIVKTEEIINQEKAKEIIDAGIEKLSVRSPVSCRSKRGICRKCYGWDLGKNKLVKTGQAVGIVAAQAIGEPGTQLTMRTFHTGGVASAGDITQGLPRVEEVFESRVPSGKALVSSVDGKVTDITPEGIIRVKSQIPNPKSQTNPKSQNPKLKTKKEESEVVEYKLPGKRAVWVKVGENIEKGEQLCEGSLDLRELFKLVGLKETQRYIVKEIQNIYASQGAVIHDKHIEIIVRQMFSRLKIKDPGESFLFKGEILEQAEVAEENARLKKEGKKPIKTQQVLLGISKVSLTTDSFLSAASFQETSRVLIKASLEGKKDKLKGLKENVIIGKLIPAGTGFKK